MTKKLITWKQLKNDYGWPYSRQHTDRLEKAEQFPKRVRLGQARVAWWEDEYLDFVAHHAVSNKAHVDPHLQSPLNIRLAAHRGAARRPHQGRA